MEKVEKQAAVRAIWRIMQCFGGETKQVDLAETYSKKGEKQSTTKDTGCKIRHK